ncbi:hypothetical protein DDE18_07265 [Nocardioides gansuensis]|uniref:Uncharacterized protein n=1 Tax=Nocardioides gansuensis TaxID=2138300 RepID=A0A2T8FBM3_9ACTN|nr:endonuclease/exonuclease/phosphatase family protein [Nocardioides gansuensis]PVG83118.1 hypothetical protein DDE18_07265 [Nocardioides gansuensis]
MKAHVALIALLASLLTPGVLGGTAAAEPGSERRRAAVETVSAGGEHGCRLPGDGTMQCWGRDTYGQLGGGKTGYQVTGAQRVGSGARWKSVSAGGASTCGIKTGGKLYCWGVNHRGQLGDGTTKPRNKPKAVSGKSKRWKDVDASWFNTCGITTNNKLYCWGDNAAGQLTKKDPKKRSTPVRVPGGNWKSVSVGSRFVCGIKGTGALYCWGGNLFGQLGTGSWSGRTTPGRVPGTWSEVSTSWTHTCALGTDGHVSCWGRNTWGQVGDGTQTTINTPRPVVGAPKAVDVTTTEGASCLLDTEGRSWCWGNNAYGILGDAGLPFSASPVKGPEGLREIEGGWRHVCAVTNGGAHSCWGQNDRAQLGNGTYDSSPFPREVEPLPAPDPAGATDFRIATANVLGNGHTRPYAHDDAFGPATTRMGWLADQLDNSAVDIMGTQEANADQIWHFLKAARGTWDAYPRPESGDDAVEAALVWRTSVWELVEATTITTQFISKQLPRPVVKLRHRVTGKEIYVMNVHNAPWDYQRKRDMATRVQIAKLAALRATGLPVFYIGDMNEKRTLLCKVTSKTDLISPYGGGYNASTGTCPNPPSRMRVDWIFGSPDATYTNFAYTRPPLMSLVTDHNMALVDVRLP